MPRPSELTKSRAKRTILTPGGRHKVRRTKFYAPKGTCPLTGRKLQLPREAKHNLRKKASLSSKRPNRPYGGKLSAEAVRRGILRAAREL
ncbi:MAG: 50S ribosomal protein L34e [Candidatus Lokiarchaeota archaeon]|nr:50S ribosomal protein L34e [Candidatus Lokiarchaeota archaeon]